MNPNLLQFPVVAAINLTLVVTVALVILGIVVAAVIFSFFNIWLKAWLSGARVGLVNLVAMRLRGVPYGVIVDARIRAVKAGIELGVDEIESQYLAGGNVISCVQALIAAQKAQIALDWQRACAIDLATKGSGKSVEEAVRTSVDPKVIDCPDPSAGRTTIGSAATYKVVLESPDSISKMVLSRGLDVGSAFEILSIDIADVDVGENVGAKLQTAQAEANKSIAQAQAEIRRAAAVALEQEMQARVQEMQAKVVEAQAQVPLAMAEAFRKGHLGVMDYYKMENIQADSSMRKSISKTDEDENA
jgi:uncharacterized protein YqfA (UPF0365 family)